MKKKFTLRALFVFAMILSLSFVNNVFAQTAPSLGTAANFGVLANTTVTNTGNTVVSGNLGVSPGTAVTNFPPGVVGGAIFTGAGSTAGQAQIDAAAAFINISGQNCTTDLTGQNLGGLTLTPGVFCFDTSAQLTGILTLDAQGDPNAVFIFKIGSTLITASNSSVVVINGGTGCNVFFQVGSSATLGTGTSFTGNILALTSITLTTGANIDAGRALAISGAVTLDTNRVDSLQCNRTTAATVNVGGRVTTARGRRGISRALITMTDSAGVNHTTHTSSSGYYNFSDVEVGQTLIINVKAKRYNFSEPTKVVSLTEELTTLDFTAY